jgi:predicted RNase H-like HicB family nuclease
MIGFMKKYLIVVEKSQTGYSAYSPDVSGCIATGKTIDKTLANMKSALALHLRTIADDGEEMPKTGGIQSYLDAERDSTGEEYFITHIAVESVLPVSVPV